MLPSLPGIVTVPSSFGVKSYHFGPHKIAMYLKRYHDIQISPLGDLADPEAPGHEPTPRVQRYRRHVDRWKQSHGSEQCRGT